MVKLDKTLLLFVVIILEGYAVLSTEMLAIRQTIPFVGSGTDTVSIIIAAVLMPLAFGYYYGGLWKPRARQGVRKKLVFNLVVAQAFLLAGLSYYSLNQFFYGMIHLGVLNRIVLTGLYSLVFLVTPVFLLGQTIPLISNYFSKEKLSRITGRMLFFSTLGSFLGAIISTLILMSVVGVHNTVIVLLALITVLTLLVSRKLMAEMAIYSMILCGAGVVINSSYIMKVYHISSDNLYNYIQVMDMPNGDRHMVLNNNASSMFNDQRRKYPYIEFMERTALDPIRDGETPKDILVMGAGAFTFGIDDHFNNFDFVDIDKNLKEVAENEILKEKLTDNKHFLPMEARAFLAQTDKQYDLIILDAYSGDLTIPEYLVTQEFYRAVKNHLKDGGVLEANFVTSPNFKNAFSRHIDNTFRSVFPYVSRSIIYEYYHPWEKDPNALVNAEYVYVKNPGDEEDSKKIYTDDKNLLFYDKPHSRPPT